MECCKVGDYLTDEIHVYRVVSVKQIVYPSTRKMIVLEDSIEFKLDDRGERVYVQRTFPENEVETMRPLILGAVLV